MAFTYVGDLSTNRDKVRFYICDTVSGSGPRPNGGNFTDAEVDGLLTVEGSWQRAAAAAFEVLAAEWAQYVDTQVGPRREALNQTAQRFAELATMWRARAGSSAPTRAGYRFTMCVDGYSDDIANDEV